jgi:hypothetical protein
MFVIFKLYSQFQKNSFVGMIKKLMFLFMFLPSLLMAQQWKKQKREIILGIGAANFLGDLGGSDQIGTYFLKDLEPSQTKAHVQGGYRYRFTPTISAKAAFSYARVSGSDRLTKEPSRRLRELEFRSDIWEVSAQFEYALIEEHIKGRYIRGKTKFPVHIYLFGGIGFLHFNPKSRVNFEGPWIALQPLGTEGQGLEGGGKKYLRYTMCIPMGIGFKYPITNQWHIGLEYGLRKTFSDYIDDVSGVYFDRGKIRDANGEQAMYFADPASYSTPYSPQNPAFDTKNVKFIEDLNGGQKDVAGATNPGQRRGNSSKDDSYMFATMSVSYKLIKGSTKSRVKF